MNLIYIIDKVRLSLIRGILIRPFLKLNSKTPLIGKNVRMLGVWNLKFGKRCIVGDNSYIECYCKKNILFGDKVTLRENSWIQCRSGFNEFGISLTIGNNVYIGPYSVIGVGGSIYIGSGTQIGARVAISAESHVKDKLNKGYVSGEVSRKGIKIGENCWIGNNVTILDGVKIGDNVVIGAGSVVTRSIDSDEIAYGVPAKVSVRGAK